MVAEDVGICLFRSSVGFARGYGLIVGAVGGGIVVGSVEVGGYGGYYDGLCSSLYRQGAVGVRSYISAGSYCPYIGAEADATCVVVKHLLVRGHVDVAGQGGVRCASFGNDPFFRCADGYFLDGRLEGECEIDGTLCRDSDRENAVGSGGYVFGSDFIVAFVICHFGGGVSDVELSGVVGGFGFVCEVDEEVADGLVIVGVVSLHFFLEFLCELIVAGVEGGAYFRYCLVCSGCVYGGVGFAGPEGYVVERDSFSGRVTVDYASLGSVSNYESFLEEIGRTVEIYRRCSGRSVDSRNGGGSRSQKSGQFHGHAVEFLLVDTKLMKKAVTAK